MNRMNELAMKYEHLIGNAFHCGRWLAPGVNADIYRDLVGRFVNKEEDPESLKDYYIALGEVVVYIEHAFFEYKNANSNNEDFCKKLDACGRKLFDHPSLDNVDRCMEEAEEILKTVHVLL